MNSAAYVSEQIAVIKQKGIPLSDQVWETALLCVGWPYVFGAWGAECTVAERKKRYREAHPTIKTACKAYNGGSCDGCKWYPNGQRVRCFDCRGFTDWVLKQFGIDLQGEGATSQWNTASNWERKGTIDSIPEDTLVCLFYTDKNNSKVMAHTGLGYKGETCECSSGVQHFTKRNKKWTHWAIPKGITPGSYVKPDPVAPSAEVGLPTLKKGDKGSHVSLLQTKLLNRGYQLPKYGADGSFGNETMAAVKQFQQDNGLAADGIVGPNTWSMLEASPEKEKLYTVTIPHVPRGTADELLKKYSGMMVLE